MQSTDTPRSMRMINWLAVVLALPAIALAAASAQQDYQDALRAKPDPQQGAQLFGACAKCHGADGGGNANGNAPRIAGQRAPVLIRQLVDYRYDKRRDPSMEPVMDGHLLQSAQDLADVAAHAATLRATAPPGTGAGAYVEQGRRLYATRCRSCHGDRGGGRAGDELAPRLGGQHYAYLLRQFHDALDGRRPKLAQSHDEYLRDLDREGLQGLADFLSRQVR
jgi:cytochrome c oxidase subunit 2